MKLKDVTNETYGKIFNKCKSFEDIFEITEDMGKKEKGDLFEVISYYILKLSPELNIGLQNIWLYDDVPTKLLKTLNLPSKDKGIDLIVQIDDEYFAVQSKFRQNPNTVIKWDEMATFYGLSFGVGEKIKGGFFITNTNDMCNEVNNSKKVRVINGNFFAENLPEHFFENICLEIKGKKILKYTKKEPLPHQQQCIDVCVKYFQNDLDSDDSDSDNDEDEDVEECDKTRCKIIMACGGGKTLGSYWIDQKLNNSITLFSVPSLNLLSQFYTDIVNQSYVEKKKIKFLLIGSDVDTDIDDNMLMKCGGLNLCVEPKEIRQHIDKVIKQKEKLIIICTYQSSVKLVVACKMKKEIQIDFGVFDEAHKTVGQAGKLFSLLLEDKNLVIKKRLFMTATPKMYKGQMDDDNKKDVLSMDNEKIYGKQVFTYKFNEAIKDKRLVDYDLISLVVTNAEIEKLIKDNKLVSFKKEFDEAECHYLGTILMLLKKIHDGTAKHLLTYHNTVNRAKKFYEFMIKINDLLYKDKKICVDTFNGSTSMSKRNRLIKDFQKSDLGVLCTARVLNEGVNIPIIDSICFVDERQSTVDIVQCIGRMLRLYQGKTMAHVFIPTFIESLEDEDIGSGAFSNTIRILKAMKSVDDDIVEYFMLKSEGTKIMGRQIVKFEGIVKMNKSQEITLDNWVGIIKGKIWKIIDSFEFKKNLLFQFVDEFKRIPQARENYNGVKLGNWYHWQKTNINLKEDKKYKLLSVNKIVKTNLDEYLINKENNKNKENYTFDEKLEILLKFVDEFKKIPPYKEEYNGVKIGSWYNWQKTKINSKEDEIYKLLSVNKIVKTNLDKYLINKENNKNKEDYTFYEKLEILFKCVDEFKKTPLGSTEYNDIKIGIWYQYQKTKINSKEDEIYKLLSVNNTIKTNLDEYLINQNKENYTFDEKLEILLKFVDEFGKTPSQKEKYNGIKIGKWYSTQKCKINLKEDEIYNLLNVNKIIKTNLDEYLINKENGKGSNVFNEKFEILLKYVDKFKKIPPCREEYNDVKIGIWYNNQKSKINSKEYKIYKLLSVNKIMKTNLDEYLEKKLKDNSDSEASEDEKAKKIKKVKPIEDKKVMTKDIDMVQNSSLENEKNY